MIKDRLTIQRDRKGGWYVVADGATERFETLAGAISVACAELGAFEELARMNEQFSRNIEELAGKLDKARAERDEMETSIKEMEETEKFHAQFIGKLIDENFRMKNAICNCFMKEYAK